MKLISWNVNGLRAVIKKGFMDFVEKNDPDILCLQEIKMQEGQAELDLPQYEEYLNYAEKKGYSGTAVFTKKTPLAFFYGINQARHDNEGRVITLEYEEFYLVNVYTPNSQKDLARLDYRMEWEDDFRSYLNELDAKKPVVLCGDLNVAHKEIDLKNPKTNKKNAGFTIEERNKMSELLDSGFLDTFRYFYPDLEDAYTWWSHFANSRERNIGWRIDYFIISERYKESLGAAFILSKVMGSDHCPVGIELEI